MRSSPSRFEQMRSFLALRADPLSQIERVNRALARWEEWEAAELMPEDLRPRVTPPSVSKAALLGVKSSGPCKRLTLRPHATVRC